MMYNPRSGFCFSHTDAALALEPEAVWEEQINTLHISDDFTADMLKHDIFRLKEKLLKVHRGIVNYNSHLKLSGQIGHAQNT